MDELEVTVGTYTYAGLELPVGPNGIRHIHVERYEGGVGSAEVAGALIRRPNAPGWFAGRRGVGVVQTENGMPRYFDDEREALTALGEWYAASPTLD